MNRSSNFTTRHREFDYLQLHWLEKTSGRPSHEWDLYIIKELIDNALDADDHGLRENGNSVELTIDLHYRHIESLDIHSLDISVASRASFPADLLLVIFDLSTYTSDKSHYNYPSRGQQGNALKTLLGIPYALRHFGYGDYANIRKPLVIETGNQAYVISLIIDETRQHAQLSPIESIPLNAPYNGTRVRVGIDRFVQERPRTLADLYSWAQRYALFNPHATFRWHVQIGHEQADWKFLADDTWHDLFTDATSVHWYEYTQLRELLLAQERELGPDTPLHQVLQVFAGFTAVEDPDGRRAKDLCSHLGFETLGDLHLTSDHVSTLRDALWQVLLRQGRKVLAEKLGGLGELCLTNALTQFFSLESPLLYRLIIFDEPSDPAHPFVLELALAHLPNGTKRAIWTGLNHTPTYEDPFYTRLLYPPVLNDEPVFGLDGFLDAYGQTKDQPVLLVLHLISPNIAYQDFSKTMIEPRPFREPLARALHEMLTIFGATQTVQIEDLQPVVHALMPQAIHLLSPNGQQQFVPSQLLRAIRRLLAERLQSEDKAELAEAWLGEVGADARLQGYIRTYVREHPDAITNLIQPERGRITLPIHPDRHTTLVLSQVERQALDEACVNKIMLVSDSELEDVVVSNGLLARFDMMLLRTEGTLDTSFEALLPYLDRFNLPLILLHHATPADCLLAERLRARLDEAGLNQVRLHDLGLTPAQGRALGLLAESGPGGGDRAALARNLDADEVTFLVERRQQMSLFSLTVEGLISWMGERFRTLGLSSKSVPSNTDLRGVALTAIKRVMTDWAFDHFHETGGAHLLADKVIQSVSGELKTEDLPTLVQDAICAQPLKSWREILSELATKRSEEILSSQQERINALIDAHIQEMRKSSR